LESFKKDKVLRIFKLSSGQDDHAIMFMDDYLKQNFKTEKKHLAENGRLLQLQIADFHTDCREAVLQLQKGEGAFFWVEAAASSL